MGDRGRQRVHPDSERAVVTALVSAIAEWLRDLDNLRRLASLVRIGQLKGCARERRRLRHQLRPEQAEDVVIGICAFRSVGDLAGRAAVAEVAGHPHRHVV